MVRVKFCVALGVVPLAAVMVIGNEPVAVGVPEMVAVPLLLSVKVTPDGSDPASLSAAVGTPDVVTVKGLIARLTLLDVLDAEVIPGANAEVNEVIDDPVDPALLVAYILK